MEYHFMSMNKKQHREKNKCNKGLGDGHGLQARLSLLWVLFGVSKVRDELPIYTQKREPTKLKFYIKINIFVKYLFIRQ